MNQLISRFLPSNKCEWKAFIKLSSLSIIQTLLFSINGFIDNLMVGNIYHEGQIVDGIMLHGEMVKSMNEAAGEGLAAAAQWWFFLASIGTFFTGAIGFFTSQYYNKGDHMKTQRSMTTKVQILTCLTLPLAIIALIIPETFSAVWSHKPIDNSHAVTLQDGVTINPAYINFLGGKYIRIAAISWIVWMFIVPQNQSLRDVSRPHGGAIALTATLVTHVGLNFVFINLTSWSIEGPAFALLISRVVNLLVTIIYIQYRHLPISLFANPLIWDGEIYRKWIRRYSYLLYAIVWTIAIVFRSYFWALFFQKDPSTPNAVDALVVLGVAGSIQNIFLVAFDGLQPLLAKYVSGNMGQDKMKEARAYADRIMGFGVILSFFISALLGIIALTLPYYGHYIWGFSDATLKQVKICILVVALVYFSWVILATTRAAMTSGSRVTLMSWIDGIFVVCQTIWIVCLGLIHRYTHAFSDFGIAFLVFFLTDIIKLPFFLVPFYKLDWTANHTKQLATHKVETK